MRRPKGRHTVNDGDGVRRNVLLLTFGWEEKVTRVAESKGL